MLPFKVVYHLRYDLDLGAHVFPSQKFKMVHDALLEEGLAGEGDFVEPQSAADEDVLRVHTPAWVRKLQTDSLTLSERMKLEIPVSESTVQARRPSPACSHGFTIRSKAPSCSTARAVQAN